MELHRRGRNGYKFPQASGIARLEPGLYKRRPVGPVYRHRTSKNTGIYVLQAKPSSKQTLILRAVLNPKRASFASDPLAFHAVVWSYPVIANDKLPLRHQGMLLFNDIQNTDRREFSTKPF